MRTAMVETVSVADRRAPNMMHSMKSRLAKCADLLMP